MNSEPKLLLLLFAIIMVACHSSSVRKHHIHAKIKDGAPSNSKNSYIHSLQVSKTHIDSLSANTTKLIVLVKVPGNKKLIEVKGNDYPDKIETTYNLFKDNAGHMIYAVEIPESESGDWFITYTSYFYPNGRLFAFERQAGFFNGECATEVEEPLHERLIKYYDDKFQLIDSTYGLKDSKGKMLKKSACMNRYDFPYKVFKNVINYKNINNIP